MSRVCGDGTGHFSGPSGTNIRRVSLAECLLQERAGAAPVCTVALWETLWAHVRGML